MWSLVVEEMTGSRSWELRTRATASLAAVLGEGRGGGGGGGNGAVVKLA